MSFQQGRNYKSCATAQQGMVVVVALFIVAIIAMLSYAMLASLARDTHRTEMMVRDVEMTNYAEGGIQWAQDLLRNNKLIQAPDRRTDNTPMISPVTEINGYRIVTRIDDLQNRYNINRLASTDNARRDEFMQLLKGLQIRLDEKATNNLIDAIKDWSTNTQGRPDLNRYYETQPIPYRAAHQPFAHVSELRLVKGMTDALYNRLAPYLVALPQDVPINILTATPPVLMTLTPKLTLSTAIQWQQVLRSIQTSEKKRVESLEILKNHQLANNYTITSDYFLVETSVSIESQQLLIYTLMERKESDDKKISIRIIWQSKGIV